MKSTNLDFKNATKDKNLRNLLQGLLDMNSEKRISSFQEIKNSPWLADIDWRKI